VAFFNLGDEDAPQRKGKAAAGGAPERRAPNSPLRGLGKPAPAPAKVGASGARGNFRPY
jgi:hypothetical protein